ncbi:hypothetical protein N0M98_09040 [Paenibacillus doosanensis]|uniref:hypothetical protein n=1 Tax=Paenibacillus doosanensis TaxID=1229154 RepID=UPI00217FA224|nr:hypothetical protein [Paenibacillus doosanensis]MCS7460286.1 hypothetical protein [Paenibacillus doosanensis]
MVSLKDLENKTKSAFKSVADTTEAFINNSISDINAILGGIGSCAEAAGRLGVRITQRALEYETFTARVLFDSGILPTDLVDRAFRVTGQRLVRDPKPKMYYFQNASRYYTGLDDNPVCTEIQFNNFRLTPGRWPIVFIHGAFVPQTVQAAVDYFSSFEAGARLFQSTSSDTRFDYNQFADIYLVSYDSQIFSQDVVNIRNAIATVLGTVVTGNSPDLIAAVAWKELERRASVTANRVLIPFLGKMKELNEAPFVNALVSHSLGCYVAATGANRFMAANPGQRPVFQKWLCMAAALPANAFSGTGITPNAPLVTNPPRGNGLIIGTSVWYSIQDSVLPFYDLTTKQLALGQTGALNSVHPVTNFNATPYVGATHYGPLPGSNRSYFELLGPVLRRQVFITEDAATPQFAAPARSSKKRKAAKPPANLKRRKKIPRADIEWFEE